jgi:hypothetical protein
LPSCLAQILQEHAESGLVGRTLDGHSRTCTQADNRRSANRTHFSWRVPKMNSDENRRLSVNSEPPPGSAPDRITADTPVCPTKKVQCPCYSDQGCDIDICWMGADSVLAEQSA